MEYITGLYLDFTGLYLDFAGFYLEYTDGVNGSFISKPFGNVLRFSLHFCRIGCLRGTRDRLVMSRGSVSDSALGFAAGLRRWEQLRCSREGFGAIATSCEVSFDRSSGGWLQPKSSKLHGRRAVLKFMYRAYKKGLSFR